MITVNKNTFRSYKYDFSLSNENLNPENIKCPICNSDDIYYELSLHKNPDVNLMSCSNCKISFASRFPKTEVLTKFYTNYYKNEDDAIAHSNPKRFANHLYKTFRKTISPQNEINILDFGGGSGDVSVLLAQILIKNRLTKRVNIHIVDIISIKSTLQNENINITFYSSLDKILDDYKYNIVLASAILEHIPQMRDIFDRILCRMQQNAVFYSRGPYMVPLAKFFNSINLNMFLAYPEHLYENMGFEFYDNLFTKVFPEKKNNFQVIISKPSIVATTYKKGEILETLAAYLFKAPYILFNRKYKLVGGWEVVIQRKT